MIRRSFIVCGALTASFFLVTGSAALARASGSDFSSKRIKDEDSGKPAKEKTQKTKPVKYVRSPDGLDALINLSKTRKEMISVYEDETARYNHATKAVDEGRIIKGQSADEVKGLAGDPVIVMPGENDTTKWIYKTGKEGYSTKNKLYFIFDKDNTLIEITRP